jgi:predicted double-glycine peptidase
VRQRTDYSCGPAALLSILKYWRAFDGDETALYGPLETDPKHGTEPAKLREVARRYGLRAEMRQGMVVGDLRRALAAGESVILVIQAWREGPSARLPWRDVWDDGHYVVLAALDEANAYFMDPSTPGAYAYIPLAELPERWHDYEDRHGPVERFHRLGLRIRGERPWAKTTPSGRPVRLE